MKNRKFIYDENSEAKPRIISNNRKARPHLKPVDTGVRLHRRPTKYSIIIGLIIIILGIIITIFQGIFDKKQNEKNVVPASTIKVHFVDVGQGDCTIIQTEKTNILIDAGEYTAATTVLGYANSLGIEKFHYVIATHPHSDHIGSLDDVIYNFDIGTIIMPKVKDELVPTGVAYENLLNSIKQKELKVKPATVDETFTFDDATLTILSPSKDYDDLNDYSVACKLTYKGKTFLFTGDAEKAPELDMVSRYGDGLKCDVLKVGHHGSYTSTNKEFLSVVKPSYAVISCGINNDYEHPHKTLLRRIEGIDTYRTDLQGTIVFETDGNEIKISTGGGTNK